MSCESKCSEPGTFDYSADIRDAFSQWYRYSDELMDNYLRLSRNIMDTYIQGVEKSFSMLPTLAKSCTIPTTQCPPYCICELTWEACEGEKLVGYIDVKNSGDDAVEFKLKAEPFHHDCQPTKITAQLEKASFNLMPGETNRVTVAINLKGQELNFDTDYRAEIKVIGRYEQCVRLGFKVKAKRMPYCCIEHGEIPTRIVPHQWYHHFQCEQLCFKPVRGRLDNTLNVTRG